MDETTWRVGVPLAFGANLLEFTALDRRGQVVGAAPLTVTRVEPPAP